MPTSRPINLFFNGKNSDAQAIVKMSKNEKKNIANHQKKEYYSVFKMVNGFI